MQTDTSPKERGVAALRQGDPQAAIQFLTEALQANPKDAEACSALGIAFCQRQRLQDGLRALQQAVLLAPGRAALHFNLAKGLELSGRRAEALASYRNTLQLESTHAAAATAVRRLEAELDPGSSLAAASGTAGLADFVLTEPTPHTPAAHAPAGAFAPPSPPAAPGVRYGQPPVPAGPLRPMAAAPTYSSQALSVPAPRRGTPWGLIIGILAAIIVVMGGLAAILFAVMAPALQQAREAARSARARAESQAQLPSGPQSAGSFAPPPVELRQAGTPADSGSELDQAGGGGYIDDQMFGFSAAFPAGFAAPMPQRNNRSVGLGGTASTQTYRTTSPSGAAYILCYAFSPEVYDQVQGQLFNLGQAGLQKSAGGALRSKSVSHQGYPAQDVEFGAASGQVGRGRLVLARPRLFVIAFETRDRSLLSKPGVTAYLDSLRIQDNVAPRSVQSPLMAPGRSVAPPMPSRQPSVSPFPEGRFGPGGPPGGRFGRPDIPRPPSRFPRSRFRMRPGGGSEFSPPGTPSPPDIPTPPTPNFPPMDGPPSFGPGGAGAPPG